MTYQHHYIEQGILTLALVFFIVSLIIPTWVKSVNEQGGKYELGLWKLCTSDDKSQKVICNKALDDNPQYSKIIMWIIRVLSIVTCLTTAWALAKCLFQDDRQSVVSAAGFSAFLSLVTLILFSVKIKSKVDAKTKYGAAYILQIIAFILCIIATIYPFLPWYNFWQKKYDDSYGYDSNNDRHNYRDDDREDDRDDDREDDRDRDDDRDREDREDIRKHSPKKHSRGRNRVQN